MQLDKVKLNETYLEECRLQGVRKLAVLMQILAVAVNGKVREAFIKKKNMEFFML